MKLFLLFHEASPLRRLDDVTLLRCHEQKDRQQRWRELRVTADKPSKQQRKGEINVAFPSSVFSRFHVQRGRNSSSMNVKKQPFFNKQVKKR